MKSLITFFVLVLVVRAHAQTATIEGHVVDVVGRPYADAHVDVFDVASGLSVAGHAPNADGSFSFAVPRALYVVIANGPAFDTVFVRADARNGSVHGLVLRAGSRTPVIPDTPPYATLIQVSLPDEHGDVSVTGAPGAVPPDTFLALITLDTGHVVTTSASADGSFQATLFAPYGTSILIKADSLGVAWAVTGPPLREGQLGTHLPEMAGTIVRVAGPPAAGTGVPFGGAGIVQGNIQESNHGSPAWTFHGVAENRSGRLEIDGIVRLLSPAVQNAGAMRGRVNVQLHKLAAADGSGSLGDNVYMSTLLTPTGLPIERERSDRTAQADTLFNFVKTAPDRAEAAIRFSLPLDVPPGFYVPAVRFFFEDVPIESPPHRTKLAPLGNSVGRDGQVTYLPLVKIGTPASPRIPVMLLAETLSDGSRGAQAIEDGQRFGLSSRIRVQQSLVGPRLDRNAQPIPYRLEPFAPTILVGVSSPLSVPLIPLRYPSGSLTLRVQKPNGDLTSIGPAPFVQPWLQGKGLHGTGVSDSHLGATGLGGNVIRQVYQLSTRDPRFEVQFEEDGRHIVTVEGTIDDVWGNTWTLGGTYEIYVGGLLSVDPSTMPGTPFEAGDLLSAGVTITPPVAAEVQVRVRLAPDSDPSRMIDRTIRGRANRFGHFQPHDGFALQRGEYRVDVLATYVDASGNHSIGSRTWGGVVAPRDSPFVGHGRRGMVNTPIVSFGSPWYFRSQTPYPTLPDPSHPMPPFHSGDVFWAEKSDTEFVLITFQDVAGTVEGLLRQRHNESLPGLRFPGTFDERAALGELPLFSSRPDAADPHLDPSAVDLWGYSYRFVERPRIAVREVIGEDNLQLTYWGFNDPYAGQLGMDFDGDQPNDIKFHWGGGVLRGAALQEPAYAIYGSLFVLVPDDDARGGSRIFPPFTAEGGPLFTLKGQHVDLFFHPTGVRPGTILHRGERASFTGYSAPTLPSKISIEVTSPSGDTRTIAGQANKIGWFFDPGFIVGESGVWKAKVKILFDGLTSAGQVAEPFPTGGVLGSRAGEFYFYVVDANAPQLVIQSRRTFDSATQDDSPVFVDPAIGPITFTIDKPPGLTNPQLTFTVTMPGFILDEGTSSSLSYTYDAQKLAEDFPNLDPGVDPIAISFLVSGDGRHFARQIAIQGKELQMPEQEPRPKRRAVRR